MGRQTPQLACPRCGYDVSGVVPTWAEKCPLEGTCSECGLVFAWVDIFRPERLHPAWSFEHVTRRRVRAFCRTVLVSLRPRKLWDELTMAAPIRVGRLMVFAVLIAVLLHVAMTLVAFWREYDTWIHYGPVRLRMTQSQYFLNCLQAIANPRRNGMWWQMLGPQTRMLGLWGLLVPAAYLLLGQTMRQMKCRRVHLIRGWVCFLPVVGAVVLFMVLANHAWWILLSRSWAFHLSQRWEIACALLTLVLIAWYAVWWWKFTSVYLRLPRARLVTTLLLVLSFLATLLVGAAIDSELPTMIGGFFNFFFG